MAESFALECPVTKRRIYIRCETGMDKGLGHVTRSMTLAKTLEERHGAEVTFLCDGNPMVERLLEAEAFPCVTNSTGFSEKEFVQQETKRADILVVDNKRDYSAEFIRALRNSRRIVFVDHCSPGSFEANLTIIPCAALSPDIVNDVRWRDRPGVLLHGAEFVLIGQKILCLRDRRSAGRGTRGPIVLTTGGCDPEGVMIRVLPWLGRMALDRELHVLVGDAFVHRLKLEHLKASLPGQIRFYPFSANGLAQAGLAICTFGVTVYELMFLGVPALVIGHSSENAETSRRLAERCRATIDLGYIGELSESQFTQSFTALLKDQKQQDELSRLGLKQVDGLGAQRIAQRIVALAA